MFLRPRYLTPLQTNVTYYDELGPQCLINPDDPSAVECMTQLLRSLVTATAAASLISTFFIGYFGNLPLALAPGIGENPVVALGRAVGLHRCVVVALLSFSCSRAWAFGCWSR